jgi:hypothetical protein
LLVGPVDFVQLMVFDVAVEPTVDAVPPAMLPTQDGLVTEKLGP